ncbi:MAG: HlyD family efflux transporter periplasmic adaptor subunit [Clostridium sp.]|jgi:multidrug resistance efflux pump|uniref:HlyD family efflux transporter periplasmic adaptor subunit n=1 Tax=Clostridium sp. TaxID=1506 RepID=UPI0025BE944B|nr:HlyD family efflux transporter periplasmic adaptor subunit [Clostridium sp.]MCH3965825.1 HlyD family efflux transporter periplasmic adaptor subunit [Clostridium sp.]MCI1716086.1 HlyD family efflux transporter periplasmic adaptor subunit [Clostridium sp.]MCI1800242.1 HlyD family efflux transporter periplasmic adaptor subunit [Clostridium sp.]MCI1814263.1 HlyD family efflux transporter periplasmic adaptor subunit [Clostridium sp.]MCI1871162.1 HlyD family efflux transporter periplasmic adaptor
MKDKRKILIIAILVAIVVALISIAFYYWYQNTYYVSTDDAQVSADFVSVTPQISGKLLELNMEEGDTVVKNQILARQDSTSLPDSNIDESLIRAPISGRIVKKQGTIGEIWSLGQTLATMIDPNNLYITANIEETKLGRIRIGQPVDITIDQFGSQKFTGKIKSVGEATQSAFSLLPSSASGTFTKVVQRIPVKIQLNKFNSKILPGTNAVVKIHVK